MFSIIDGHNIHPAKKHLGIFISTELDITFFFLLFVIRNLRFGTGNAVK